jgi:non-ribosomal peptide synthetase component E (peptide arylation enzyme)
MTSSPTGAHGVKLMTTPQYKTRLTDALRTRYIGSKAWHDVTFYDFIEKRALEHPDRLVFIDETRSLTYGELKDQVDRCAAFLKSIGIGPGDVVTMQFPNRVEFPIVFFSLELIGAIANKISPDFRRREVEYILRFSNSKAFVCASNFKGFDYAAMIDGLRSELPNLTTVVVSGDTVVKNVHSLELGLAAAAPLPTAERIHMSPDAVMRMAFTSGTTGDPKGVMHSFNTTLYAAEVINNDMHVTKDEVLLIWLPVGLNWGYLSLLQTVMVGARAVLMEKFQATRALELIEKHRATFIPTAPASLLAIMNVPDFQKFDCSSLRVVVTGGASAAIETIRDYQKYMKGHLLELYGMLETGFHTFTRFEDDPEKVNGTIGRIVGQMELRIIDEDGKDVPYGSEGEIAAYGPSVHLGYFNNPNANKELFTDDDWFRTGDLGKYVDQAGNVMIVGRRKEMINRGGKKYFPREIEEFLYAHPSILHAAIVGVNDVRLGEKNCLCVVLKPEAKLTLDDVTKMLKGQVADYKLPEMLEFYDELPFTPTGKIRRHVLTADVISRIHAR